MYEKENVTAQNVLFFTRNVKYGKKIVLMMQRGVR